MNQSDTALLDLKLIDVSTLAELLGVSRPTVWRHHAGQLIPQGVKIGRAVRWRLKTGNPQTGILDWLDAGCPPVDSHSSPTLEGE